MQTMTSSELLKKTLRMTGILVGSCVVFVGALSLVAVLVVGKAFDSSPKTIEASSVSPPAKKI